MFFTFSELRVEDKIVSFWYSCVYLSGRSPGRMLGLIALLFYLLSRVAPYSVMSVDVLLKISSHSFSELRLGWKV